MGREFKKSVFGGFKKKDVIAYLSRLEEERLEEKGSAERKVNDLRSLVKKYEDDIAAFEEKYDSLKAEFDNTKLDAEDYKQKFELLDKSFTEQSDELKMEQERLKELSETNKELVSELSASRLKLNDLTAACDNGKKRIAELEKEADGFAAEKDAFVTEYEAKLSSAEMRLTAANSENEKLSGEITVIRQENASLRSSLEDEAGRSALLRSALEESKAEYADTVSAGHAAEDRCAILKEELERAQEENRRLQDYTMRLEKRIAEHYSVKTEGAYADDRSVRGLLAKIRRKR